jgi:hypothetical protein
MQLTLWTGSLSYARYRSLSISKLFRKDGGGGGVEGFLMNSQATSEGSVGVRYVMNSTFMGPIAALAAM